ncbi:MAG: hypothetical protein R3A46_10900 [Thermomicrobiales bacterium]
MNEMLNDTLAFQRYQDDVKRGEIAYNRQATGAAANNGPRSRIAATLLSLAIHLQPELQIEVQRPVQSATA